MNIIFKKSAAFWLKVGLLVLLPILYLQYRVSIVQTCCSENRVNYNTLNFLGDILPFHGAQLSVSLLETGLFFGLTLAIVVLISIIFRTKAYIVPTFNSLLLMLPLVLVLHLSSWFHFQSYWGGVFQIFLSLLFIFLWAIFAKFMIARLGQGKEGLSFLPFKIIVFLGLCFLLVYSLGFPIVLIAALAATKSEFNPDKKA